MARVAHLFVAAEIADCARPGLEAALAEMTGAPGQALADNPLVPFGRIEGLHAARIIIFDDPSLADRVGITDLASTEPTRLALIADADGSAEALIDRLVAVAAPGLVRLFGHCDPALTLTALPGWLSAHRVAPAATYRNAPARSVRQVREEAALHDALLAARLARPEAPPDRLWPDLLAAGRGVPLTPPERPGLGERLRDVADFVALPLIALLLAPILLLALPIFIVMLRRRETTDPVIAPRPSRPRNTMLSGIEDHGVANQYSAIGTLKPGTFRLRLTRVVLWVIDWGGRHLFAKGRLGRVNTIHFASWTFLDGGRRVFFASNYDGSREAYNDDFINKVAFGLNLSFSNGLGYPHTDWLIVGGAKHEQDFKRFLFHHQIPTQVWYDAFPSLTTYDMTRNARLRTAFEAAPTGAALTRFVAAI